MSCFKKRVILKSSVIKQVGGVKSNACICVPQLPVWTVSLSRHTQPTVDMAGGGGRGGGASALEGNACLEVEAEAGRRVCSGGLLEATTVSVVEVSE